LGSRSCGDANILEAQVFSGAYERDWGMNDPYLLFIINGEMMGICGNIYIYILQKDHSYWGMGHIFNHPFPMISHHFPKKAPVSCCFWT